MKPRRLRLVLASRSRARRDLLRAAGYRFSVCAADIDESAIGTALPFGRRLRRLAECKAMAVAGRFPDACVVGMDTALILAGRWIGKAADACAAQDLLEMLAGRRHRIGSAICVVYPVGGAYAGRAKRRGVDYAWVSLRPWSRARIRHYVQSASPFDWAGAYALQGRRGGPAMIAKIEGDPSTVIGCPLPLLDRILETVENDLGGSFLRAGER